MTDSHHPSRPELYDLRHGDADRGDVPFYVDRARATDGPVLELACGTGRVYLPLVRAGVDAVGVDTNANSLARLREMADREGLEHSVRVGDMTALDVDRAYDLVICPFNALQHARTLADQRATLSGVYDALAPGGRFVFDVFVPRFDVICETYGEWTEQAVQYEGRDYTVRSRTRVASEVEQLFAVETELCGRAGDVIHRSEHELAMLPTPHVQLLADGSRFASYDVDGGFGDDALTDGDSIQVWTLQKAE